jgi:hypothetical protein
MARANSRDTKIRHALETICTEMAVVSTSRELVVMRIKQAEERSGLSGLLIPALHEMEQIGHATMVTQQQVASALKILKG